MNYHVLAVKAVSSCLLRVVLLNVQDNYMEIQMIIYANNVLRNVLYALLLQIALVVRALIIFIMEFVLLLAQINTIQIKELNNVCNVMLLV